MANKDDSRPWMLGTVQDETGQVKVFMGEEAALSLANVDAKDEFEEKRANPPKAVLKNLLAYIATLWKQKEHDMSEAPTRSSLQLVDLLEKPKEVQVHAFQPV